MNARTDFDIEKATRVEAGVSAPEQTPIVELNFKSSQLRKMFENNLDDITRPEGDHDRFNRLAHEAQAGWNGAAHTSVAAHKKQEDKAALAVKTSGARAFAQTVTDNFNFNINLEGIRLDDNHLVNINEQGVLMVRGEGENSEFRAATLDEKLQLEGESQACSIAITEQEIEMNAYLNGTTEVLPDSLRDMAEQQGLIADDLTRDDFKGLIQEKYADSPHISARIISSDPLTSGTLSLDSFNLLPSEAPLMSTAINSETGVSGMSTPEESFLGAELDQEPEVEGVELTQAAVQTQLANGELETGQLASEGVAADIAAQLEGRDLAANSTITDRSDGVQTVAEKVAAAENTERTGTSAAPSEIIATPVNSAFKNAVAPAENVQTADYTPETPTPSMSPSPTTM